MLRRLFTALALCIAFVALILPYLQKQPVLFDYVSGDNNKLLFLTLEHHGCSNVHLATAQSLLELYPSLEIHWGSFPAIGKKLSRLSAMAKKRQEHVMEVVFYPLKTASFTEAIGRGKPVGLDENGLMLAATPPGIAGIKETVRDLQIYMAPWEADEHFQLYEEIGDLIDSLDPAVVVLDTIFGPAIEATRARNRSHVFITPNVLVDSFLPEQPYGAMFWKFPGMGSGFPFPLPWRLIPANIYMNLILIYNVVSMPQVAAKKAALRDMGIVDPITISGFHRPDVPWITQTMPGASISLDYVPQNVSCVGPIVFSPAPAEEQDPELMAWARRGPTIFINLGSVMIWGIAQTRQMIAALQTVLSQTQVQVLWKYKPADMLKWDWESEMRPLTATGRVRVVDGWLSVDPPAVLQSGSITAYITHGGANGYHEALEAGIPMVVLPIWLDLYNYAQLVEDIGIGVWGCRKTSPLWTSECLSDAIMRVSDGGPESSSMKSKSKALSDTARKSPGREAAARIVAQMARLEPGFAGSERLTQAS